MYFSACSLQERGEAGSLRNSRYMPPKVVGRITNTEITESNGLAASKCAANVFWTHNDSGDDAFLFALDQTGRSLGTWKIAGATNEDWEDIASFKDTKGTCYLYIGEIGDNKLKRSGHVIYRITEPKIEAKDSTSTRSNSNMSLPAEVLKFSYPDKNHNAETLLVHPSSGDIYVLTKRVDGPAGIFRIRPLFSTEDTVTAERVGEIKVPSVPNGQLTGGDISPDGKRVILCDYTNGYELSSPENSSNFDDIWKQVPEKVDLGKRAVGEAVCYSSDGESIFANSEKKDSPLFQIVRMK